MVRTIQQLADMVGGRVEGDQEAEIEQAQPLHDAGPRAITFVDHERHYPELCVKSGRVRPSSSPTAPRMDKPLIRVTDPRAAFTAIVRLFREEPLETHPGHRSIGVNRSHVQNRRRCSRRTVCAGRRRLRNRDALPHCERSRRGTQLPAGRRRHASPACGALRRQRSWATA